MIYLKELTLSNRGLQRHTAAQWTASRIEGSHSGQELTTTSAGSALNLRVVTSSYTLQINNSVKLTMKIYCHRHTSYWSWGMVRVLQGWQYCKTSFRIHIHRTGCSYCNRMNWINLVQTWSGSSQDPQRWSSYYRHTSVGYIENKLSHLRWGWQRIQCCIGGIVPHNKLELRWELQSKTMYCRMHRKHIQIQEEQLHSCQSTTYWFHLRMCRSGEP